MLSLKLSALALALLVPASLASAQDAPPQPDGQTQPPVMKTQTIGQVEKIDTVGESSVVTEHTATIDGEEVPFKATTGTQPVYDRNGNAIASLFYTYYQRTDVEDKDTRPLTISFNGGPGSASVWMHIGYTGPFRLKIDDEGFPVQPYGFEENPHSILDKTDIVYVNPVNTGYSRAKEGVDTGQFFGVNDDLRYLAEWIRMFVTKNERWASPKFLIGESYGTTRVSGLAGMLQGQHWMYLNGVVLVSPTDLGIDRDGPVGDALTLPHYAATAWYFGELDEALQERDLEEMLPEVEAFVVDEYVPALMRGGFLEEEKRNAIAEKVAMYAGVSPDFVLDHNLALPINHWRKELMRDKKLTVGRLDSRYQGRDRQNAGTSYDYDPALTAWNHAFTPAINIYLRQKLGYETDLTYYMFGPTPGWERDGDRTGEMLRGAMAENPYLKVMIQAGYYDGGTDYFSAKYSMWQLDPSGLLKDRMRYHAYRSGHMMYLRQEDLGPSNQHIRDFIEWSIPEEGTPANYGRRTPVSAGGE